MTSVQPTEWTRDDGTDIPGPNPAPYHVPAARGQSRADEIAAALAAGIDPRHHVDVVHDGPVRAILDPRTRGESISYTRPAPSPFVATVSGRKVTRGKRGTSTTITTRGRVLVVGDSTAIDDQTTRTGRVPRVVISHAIDALRDHNRYGHVDGDRLAALTSRLYDVPDLIGTDHWSWSGAVEIPSSGAAILSRHRTGISGGMSPLLDAAIGPEYRTRDDDPAWFPAGYPAPVHIRRHATRVRISTPRGRKLDAAQPSTRVILAGKNGRGTSWWTVSTLRAGTDRPGTVFIGFDRVTRGETVKNERRAVIRDTFVVDSVGDVPTLAAIVADDGPGRYVWTLADGTDSGIVTVDKRGRLSITSDSGIVVRQCRTIDALRRRVAIATS